MAFCGLSIRESPKPAPKDLSHHFSDVSNSRVPSEMKRYYRFFQIPGIGNLAGGLPNEQYFPFDTLEAQVATPDRWQPTPNEPGSGLEDGAGDVHRQSRHMVVPKISNQRDLSKRIDLSTALQYGTAEGYPPLHSFLRQFSRQCLHPNVPYSHGPEIILTCGSTDGFSKTLELLTNVWVAGKNPISERPGLIVEKFMYSSVLSQAGPRGMNIVPVEVDSQGMLPTGIGGLEDVLANWDESRGKRPSLIYTVTMGHNPTGGVLSVERRKQIYALCQRFDVIIAEDDPYWYLQFPSAELEEARSRNLTPPERKPVVQEGKSSGYPFLDSLIPSYLSMDVDGRVVRLDTFSKTIAPGCRLGWITAQPAFIDKLLRIAEATTQQPSGFVQSMVSQVIMGKQPDSATANFHKAAAAGAGDTFSGWDTSGWVRWLAGLRGEYERRMGRMCTILDEGSVALKQSTPTNALDREWGVITKTRLISFDWPRGGMFVWLRVHFETHPLWQSPSRIFGTLSGPIFSLALTIYLTHKPHIVLAAPGLMFGADESIRDREAWAYMRLCFAAESDANVDAGTHRFVSGLHRFWSIRDVSEIEDLAREFSSSSVSRMSSGRGRSGMGSFEAGMIGC